MNYGPSPEQNVRRLQGFAFVVVLHILMIWALASGLAHQVVEAIKGPVEMAVVEDKTPPPPPPPPPTPDVKMPQVDLPINLPPPPVNVETPPPPPPPIPVVNAPPPKDTTAVNTVARPAPPPPEQSAAEKVASMEGAYALQVRTMLNSTKRYPTGRQASQQRPKGKVKVWFTLGRDGHLIEAGIQESSDNNMLDDAALATVRRGTYPPFPPNTWTGQEQHKFTADLEFVPPG